MRRCALVMSRRAYLLRAVIGLSLVVLCTEACPIPIAHTEALSPPVVGVLRGSDGVLISGARVTVATEYDDSACARAALETTTGAAGTFRLPTTEKRYGVMWVIPNLDRLPPGYRLCISVGDTLQTAYFGRGSLRAPAPLDSLTCLEWAWNRRTRITCTCFAGAEQTLASGGTWTDGEATGWYQLILTEEPTRVPHRRFPVERPRAYVQWVEPGSNDSRATVRSMVELSIDPKVTALWEIDLLTRYRKWYVSLRGTRPKFMRDFASTQLMFELGPPGHVRSVEVWK